MFSLVVLVIIALSACILGCCSIAWGNAKLGFLNLIGGVALASITFQLFVK